MNDQTNSKKQIPNEPLFHYTSFDAFQKIIASRKIWATDIHYLNDASEFMYTLELAREVMKSRSAITTYAELMVDKSSDLDRNVAELMINSIHMTEAIKRDMYSYVFSLTEERSLLSQWRAYCSKGGVSVGFNSQKLLDILNKHNLSIFKCEYCRDRQIELINSRINEMKDLESYKTFTENLKNNPSLKFFQLFMVRLSQLAIQFKHPDFHEEKEWRIGILTPSHTVKKEQFRPKDSCLVPYQEISIECSDGSLPIEEILIGPSTNAELAKLSIERYLKMQDVKCQVNTCGIPLRVVH